MSFDRSDTKKLVLILWDEQSLYYIEDNRRHPGAVEDVWVFLPTKALPIKAVVELTGGTGGGEFKRDYPFRLYWENKTVRCADLPES